MTPAYRRLHRSVQPGRAVPGALRVLVVILGLALSMGALTAESHAGDWGMTPPIPDNDPQWEKVRTLWVEHYGGRNLGELISVLNPLLEKYPDTIEPYLWLARAHHLHARYHRRDRGYHFEMAEQYAARACRMDPGNSLAARALVDTLFHSRDREYIMANYEKLLRSCAPLPVDDALPDMDYFGNWDGFEALWNARADLEKAAEAVKLVEEMAGIRPHDVLALTWASRANYYVGECYTSLGKHHFKAMPYYRKGISYAGRALKIEPMNVPANYWYQINLARSIQHKWLVSKAGYLMSLLSPLLFCARENSQYYFDGPMLTLSTMITNGGWVTEKGMQLAGVSLEQDMTAIELAAIMNPEYYYIPYIQADLLAYKGRYKEALEILDELLERDPDANPWIPENRSFLRFAKTLREDILKKQQKKPVFLIGKFF